MRKLPQQRGVPGDGCVAATSKADFKGAKRAAAAFDASEGSYAALCKVMGIKQQCPKGDFPAVEPTATLVRVALGWLIGAVLPLLYYRRSSQAARDRKLRAELTKQLKEKFKGTVPGSGQPYDHSKHSDGVWGAVNFGGRHGKVGENGGRK